ncbi:MAG TPA: ankyrin repeat domain-containing protein [Armatimonadota bacterium]|nr:ankyrin repeat domain-containing protein [Armatimonadota bacterium]
MVTRQPLGPSGPLLLTLALILTASPEANAELTRGQFARRMSKVAVTFNEVGAAGIPADEPPEEDPIEAQDPPAFRLVRSSDAPGLRRLLALGLDPNTTNRAGETLLMREAGQWGGVRETFSVLLEAGADIHRRDREGMTALMYAARSFNVDAASALLHHGAHVNARDRERRTALHWCVNWAQYDLVIGGKERRHGQIAETLIAAGADIDAQDKQGRTALMWASGWRHEPTFRVLLRHGAAVERRDRRGRTALTWCAEAGAADSYVQALLKAGATVRLMDALLLGDEPTARRLLDSGVGVRARGPSGETALMYAAFQGRLALVNILLGHPTTSLNAVDEEGNTALMLALGVRRVISQLGDPWRTGGPPEGRERLLRALLAAGARVNQANRDGETALMWAAELGRVEMVQSLLAAGADVRRRPPLGGTALARATLNRHTEVVRLLREAGAKE